MKLKKFKIKSYRSCLNVKYTLHDDLTALIGINGSGKSNILNGMLLLKKMSQVGRRLPRKDPSLNSCQIDVEIEHQNKIIYMKCDVSFSTDEKNYDEVQYSRVRWNFKNFFKSNKWYELPFEIFAYRNSLHYNVGRPNMDILRYQHYSLDYLGRKIVIDKTVIKAQSLLFDIFRFFNGINYYSASQFSDPSRCPVSIELEEEKKKKRLRTNVRHEQFLLDLYK